MADYTRNLAADITQKTTVDNNVKLTTGAEPPMTELAPDADVFGSVINDWTIMDGSAVFSALPVKGVATITEPGDGKLHLDGNATGPNRSIAARRNNVSYSDADIVLYYNKTDAGHVVPAGNAQVTFYFWRSQDNLVEVLYRARNGAGSHVLEAYKVINGAVTALYSLADLGLEADIWYRIKRVASTQTFTIYYALADPIATPVNWIQIYSGVVNDATYFNSSHLLYPISLAFISGSYTLSAELDFYDQIAGAEERFWPGSQECDIINSAAGAVEYAYDAGIGTIWALTGASCTKTEPGTSTVKFKLGYSDSGLGVGVTWVDAVWQTIAQVLANAAAGLYDGHRYLHVQTQFYSDGTDQPSLTDFTISGAAVLPPLPPSAEYNLDEVTNDLDAVPLT